MQERARKARRVASVQAQIQKLEQWKLSELQRQLLAGEAAQRELIAALNADHPLYGLFIDAMASRLRTLAAETGRTREARDAHVQHLLACTGRLKTAERLATAADRAALRDRSRSELLDLIEVLTASGTQASRKLTAR